MHRQPLLQLLRDHTPADAREARLLAETIAFVETQPDCFERSLRPGHVTASAWITSPDRRRVVLVHHRKLDRWLQPGGHADGNPDVVAVARREAEEETGLTDLRLIRPAIFDVDVHRIPAHAGIPEHLHYDIRFAFESDSKTFNGSVKEVKNIRWINVVNVEFYTDELSVLRMAQKQFSL